MLMRQQFGLSRLKTPQQIDRALPRMELHAQRQRVDEKADPPLDIR